MTTIRSNAPAAVSDESSPRYRGWRVVFACYVAAVFCWGFGLYGHGVYLAELHRLHGWSTASISSATTAFYLLTAALVVSISDAIAGLGPKRVMLFGGCCFGIAVALLAVIAELWQLYVAYLIMAIGAASMHVGSISNVIGLWFDRRRGLALSLALNGASSGGILVTPLLVLAIAHYGFTAAMLSAAVLFAVVLLPIVALCIDRPVSSTTASSASPARDRPPAAAWTRRRALQSPVFWSVAAPFAMALTAQVGFLVHQIAILQPALGRAQAGLSVGALTVTAIFGRLLFGAFADRLDVRRFTAWSLVSQAAALFTITQTASPIALFAACVVFGLSAGNLITLPSLVIHREFDTASFGVLVGLSWAITQFTYAFGPGVLGILRDATGGYGTPLALCVALDLAAAALVLIRPAAAKRGADQQAPIDFR